jgi:tyrosine decarboxylase/aspartate 1-decarboxylase
LILDETFNFEKELTKDFNYTQGQILSSMNSLAYPLAQDVFCANLNKNLGDPALFPGATNIEKYVIGILGNLYQIPSSGVGVVLSGGSEANITALWSIRNQMIKLNRRNKTAKIIVPESVHISIDKAADLLGLSLVKVPVTPQYQIDLKQLEEKISDDTIAVVGVAGTTAFGTIDPLFELNKMCIEHELKFHIDAAFGGLVFPFISNATKKFNLSFDLESVTSITVDIHKMGRVPIPGGCLLWRNDSYSKAIQFTLPYLPGCPSQRTITGTRSAASAIAFASLWENLGFKGFKETAESCIKNTQFLAEELRKRGFIIPIKPVINILGVKPPKNFYINLENLHQQLWNKGWTTSIMNGLIRMVIMPITGKSHLKRLLSLIDSLNENSQAF